MINHHFDFIYDIWKKLVLQDNIAFNNSVYLSEKDSADRNFV